MRSRLLPFLPLLMFAAAMPACDCNGNGNIQGVQPRIAAKVIAVNGKAVTLPKLEDKEAIDFGNVSILASEPANKTVSILNEGNALLTLRSTPKLKIGTAFALSKVLETGPCPQNDSKRVIKIGGCTTLVITFNGSVAGATADELILESDDPTRADWKIPLIAVGAKGTTEVCAVGGSKGTDPTDACATPGETPATIDFGLIAPGTTSPQRKGRIHNGGILPITVSRVELRSGNDSQDFSFDLAGWTGTIEPGESKEFNATFTPSTGGNRKAFIDVFSDDPATVQEGTPASLELIGIGDAPGLCVDPLAPIDFGEVEVGSPADVQAEIRSCGTRPLEVRALAMDGSPEFSLVDVRFESNVTTLPKVVEVGKSVVATLRYKPVDVGPDTGRLKITSNDTASANAFFALTGKGVRNACELSATVQTVDFGQVALTRTGQRTLVLANRGRRDCVITNMTLDAAATAAVFGFQTAPTFPITVTPNALLQVKLTYAPASASVAVHTGHLAVASNDPASPLNVTLKGAPAGQPICKLDVVPALNGQPPFGGRVLRFGQVKINNTKVVPVTLTNVGSDDCRVTGASLGTLTNGAFRVNGASPAFNTAISPGATAVVAVAFKPTSQTDFDPLTNTLIIQTNEPVSGECTGFSFGGNPDGCKQIGLQGSGATAAIEVVPQELRFAQTTVGCNSATKQVKVYNVGNADVTVRRIAVEPAGSPFVVTQQPALPLTLGGGQTFNVSVRYAPPDASSHSALLVIENDGQNQTYTVPLSGSGTTDGHQIDRFQQADRPKADVLWVVDNSGSMSDKQNLIATQAPRFMSTAIAQNVDFHIGVITMQVDGAQRADSSAYWRGDAIEPGVLFGRPKIIESTTPDPVNAFAHNVKVGECCSDSQEAGLQAAQMALTQPLINDPNKNGGFLRPDAKLNVIVIGDEPEQSNGTIDFYVDAFQNIKGQQNSSLFSFSAVVGDRGNGCDANGVTAQGGDAYIEVARRTGGLFRSICSADFGQLAQDLALNSFAARTQYFLTRAADPATLTVEVNGTRLTLGQQVNYDAASNSIVFTSGNAPPQGAQIKAEYDTVCF